MEGLGEVGWERVSGCEGVSGDVDGDGAVAACGGDQVSDGPAGGGLQPAGHGKGCWTAGCFSDSACFVLQAAFFRSRNSLSTSSGVRYPRTE